MWTTETGVGLDLKIVFTVARHCHLVSLRTCFHRLDNRGRRVSYDFYGGGLFSC